MSRFLLLTFLVSVTSPAFARDDVSSSVDAIATNACAMLATKILTGVDVGDMGKSILLCNAHPRREECFNTQRLIAKYGKAAPGLTCGVATAAPAGPVSDDTARPSAAAPTQAEIDLAENACAMVATTILTGAPVGNLADSIAICNRHPNKRSCLDTKNFIASQNNGDAHWLTCGDDATLIGRNAHSH